MCSKPNARFQKLKRCVCLAFTGNFSEPQAIRVGAIRGSRGAICMQALAYLTGGILTIIVMSGCKYHYSNILDEIASD